jgi:hypothetical protein
VTTLELFEAFERHHERGRSVTADPSVTAEIQELLNVCAALVVEARGLRARVKALEREAAAARPERAIRLRA